MATFPQPVFLFPQSSPTPLGFAKLFRFRDELASNRVLTVDFSNCHSIEQHSVAFLGGLVRFMESQKGRVHLDWATCKPRVLRQLVRNGFADVFDGPQDHAARLDEHVVRYREDRSEAPSILGYLRDKWLGRDWIRISDALRNSIIGTTYEIYANAFEHSGSPIGVTTCGHHSERAKQLSLTVVDFGQGIPGNVRTYLQRDSISARNALWWAFQRGATTQPRANYPRGMGFELLKDFVKVNQGSIEVYSGDGYAKVSERGDKFVTLSTFFHGTVVHIVFKCDERHYMFASEVRRLQRDLF